MYKIVRINKNEFVIYRKKFFFWRVLKTYFVTRHRNVWAQEIFADIASAEKRVKEMSEADRAKEFIKKQKFKKNTKYYNKFGNEYNPMYENSDPTKNQNCYIGPP